MNRIKPYCFAVLIIMVVIVTACSGNQNKNESATSSPDSVNSASPDATSTNSGAPSVKPKDPITISLFAPPYNATMQAGVQTDPVSKAMEAATGVRVNWDTTYTPDKLKTMIASGDLADIVTVTDITQLKSLIESGAIQDVSKLIETNGDNIKKNGAKALAFSKQNLSNNTGGIYAIPLRITPGSKDDIYFQPYVGFHIRWDYFKEIGSPVLKSYDDVANAIIEIQKKHPTTAEGKKTYATSLWSNWSLWNYTVMSQSIGGLAAIGDAQLAFADTSYEFVDGLHDPEGPIWKDGAFFNKFYRAGILDPDSFTQTDALATAKMNAGQDTMILEYWLINGQNATLSKTNADYLSIPLEGAHYNAALYNPVGGNGFAVISKDNQHPERAIDLINWIYSDEGSRTMLDGAKGDTWTDEGGKAALTEKGIAVKNDADYMLKTGAGKYINITGIDPQAKDSTGNQFIDLFSEPEVMNKTLTSAQKEWLQHYGFESSNDLWHKYGGYAQNGTYQLVSPTKSDEFKRMDTKLVSYLTTAIPKLIMSKSESAFAAQKEKMIKDIEGMNGYQAYMEEAKKIVEATRTAAEPFK